MAHNPDKQPLSRGEIIERLHEHGIMPTAQRIEIAELMFERAHHLSAEQVMAGLAERKTRVSKATVYNTLGLFADKGLVNTVVIDPDRVLYDSNTEPHHHFYNHDTGELIDIEADAVDVGQPPPLPEGTEAEGMDVVIHIRSRNRANR